jgi:hypothetical protein
MITLFYCYFLRKSVFKLISIRSHQEAGIQGLTLHLRPEEKRKGRATAHSRNLKIWVVKEMTLDVSFCHKYKLEFNSVL